MANANPRVLARTGDMLKHSTCKYVDAKKRSAVLPPTKPKRKINEKLFIWNVSQTSMNIESGLQCSTEARISRGTLKSRSRLLRSTHNALSKPRIKNWG